MVDRRPTAAQDSQEWAFQRQVEEVLYGNGYSQQTGAVYRLLQRSGVRERALPLKKACIQQGLLTQHEYDWMYSHLVDVRSFTLIPLDALRTALAIFGRNDRSLALVTALGLQPPDDWADSEDGGDGEEAENGGEGGDGDEGGDGEEGEGSGGSGGGGEAGGDDSADDVSDAGTEAVDETPVVGDEPGDSVTPPNAPHAAKRQHVGGHAHELLPELEVELSAHSTPTAPYTTRALVIDAFPPLT